MQCLKILRRGPGFPALGTSLSRLFMVAQLPMQHHPLCRTIPVLRKAGEPTVLELIASFRCLTLDKACDADLSRFSFSRNDLSSLRLL